ncbi:Uncharacterised protein [Sphingobacterium multivorum]|uniref:Uncharacterized protein n=1 Tax=Sphingobacterium multivorum TaxID=28454 RepID=A0A2X2J0A6_SPHMU|nr:hypothetical protein [Sphingobacterium multivorum]SPZ84943.1 Uncharacterised protein [Sphingobacterium multivorum]
MNTINYYKLDTFPKSIVVFCLSLIMILTSCKDDLAVDGAFALKDNPSKLTAAADGLSETYTVQATGKWKLSPSEKKTGLKSIQWRGMEMEHLPLPSTKIPIPSA